MSPDPVRVLFVSDTHLGFDLPARPRVERRRRGEDFFACYEQALRPALEGEVDVVVHGGDLLDHPRVPAGVVDRALEPLRRVAQSGVPVVLLPGNHERSAIPRPLFASHPDLHVFTGPGTFVVERAGLRVAFAGFPYYRHGVRQAFPGLLAATGYREARADVAVLCVHQCVEGATCGPGYTFRGGDDVIRAADIPRDVAAVLAGHIHRHQVLARDLQGRPLAARVLYAGSVERTSFVERDETKGFLLLSLAAADRRGGRLADWQFRPLPARPMTVLDLPDGLGPAAVDAALREAVALAPADAVLQVRVSEATASRHAALLQAGRLRALAPAAMTVSVAVRRPDHETPATSPRTGRSAGR